MRIVTLASSALLIGSAPADVPTGRFQEWRSWTKAPLNFTSGGITIAVAPLQCPAHPLGDNSCSWDHYNNQAQVTITAPGVAPITVKTDPAGAYARIAVARLRSSDRRPGVIIESQSGGSGGDMTLQLLVPTRGGYLPATSQAAGIGLQGALEDGPRDVSGDGEVDLVLQDPAFAHVFGCNACTPRPPLIVTVKGGRIVDESRDPALRAVFLADMVRWGPVCLSTNRYRNGACATYVADAARAGRLAAAWSAMLKHYEPGEDLWEPCDVPVSQWKDHQCPAGHVTHFADFPASLRAFLKRAGYLPDLRPFASAPAPPARRSPPVARRR
ncbi:hypothetical protein [uncultured Sphingomonas sp.]|uniref:hypothetical protein n=1 Tax=uncultured Sphingomonas sp. TaxID=158754 RepID=UPI0030F72D2E